MDDKHYLSNALKARPPRAMLPPGGFVRLPTILVLVPVGKSSVWEMVRRGDFPAPVRLSKRVTAWRSEDIAKYVASRRPMIRK